VACSSEQQCENYFEEITREIHPWDHRVFPVRVYVTMTSMGSIDTQLAEAKHRDERPEYKIVRS
jgi:hypothetical protein